MCGVTWFVTPQAFVTSVAFHHCSGASPSRNGHLRLLLELYSIVAEDPP